LLYLFSSKPALVRNLERRKQGPAPGRVAERAAQGRGVWAQSIGIGCLPILNSRFGPQIRVSYASPALHTTSSQPERSLWRLKSVAKPASHPGKTSNRCLELSNLRVALRPFENGQALFCSLQSRQKCVQGTASNRAFEIGCLQTSQTPYAFRLIRTKASSIARRRRASE